MSRRYRDMTRSERKEWRNGWLEVLAFFVVLFLFFVFPVVLGIAGVFDHPYDDTTDRAHCESRGGQVQEDTRGVMQSCILPSTEVQP